MVKVFYSHDVEIFIASLEKPTTAKVLRTVDLLEMFGYQLNLPHSKKVGPSLFELRIRGQQEIRIFYTLKNAQAILLHGFIKKSRGIPAKELKQANKKLSHLT